jgi:DNA ligase-1
MINMDIRLSLLAISLLGASTALAQSDQIVFKAPQVVLAQVFDSNIDVTQYWKSEKLDGIRAFWDGKTLLTRKGNKITAPRWFIDKLPNIPLEGELWAGRGNFHLVQQTVLDTSPNDESWRAIKLMLFDMPQAEGTYQQRYASIKELVNELCHSHIDYVEHQPIENELELLKELDAIDGASGEGLMLRKFTSSYHAGRSDGLVKLKKYQDAEARVIGYKLGNGKYKGKMGSLLVQLESGKQFFIGSGFSDGQRDDPPHIGSIITFRYNGYTHKGVPKFARYLRERVE